MLFFLWCLLGIAFVVRLYTRHCCGECKSRKRLDGKTVIVTGASSGIGFETAKDLAGRGARVILACRDMARANKAKNKIVSYTGNEQVIVKKLDLASLKSVREFANDINLTETRLHILVNSAGAIWLSIKKTEDDIDLLMQVNHLGPFLLTNLLVELIQKTGSGRIVFVASVGHKIFSFYDFNEIITQEKQITSTKMYCFTKLAGIMNSNELARRLKDTGITVNCLHPGWIRSNIYRRLPKIIRRIIPIFTFLYMKTCTEGAQTSIHLAVSEEAGEMSGKYFIDCKEASRYTSSLAQDEAMAKKMWAHSEKLTSK